MTSVLMTADAVGGVWTYALELADALAPCGITVTLAAMGWPLSADQRTAAERSAVVDVHESDFALEWMDDPWADVDRAGEWLLDVEEQVRPDVVHLNGFVHGVLPWRAPALVVGHSCVLSWWHAVHGVDAPPAWDEYRRRVAAGLAVAGAVAAPTRAMLAELQRWYGVVGGYVTPNGRGREWVRPVAKERLVLGGGRLWDEGKNVALLERVADRLDWPVSLAGDPQASGGDRLPDAAAPRGEPRMLGRLPFDEFASWLLGASVFVLPARYEPFGLAALEAGLAGCALVLGDIASLREVWDDAALFVDPDDDEELVRLTNRLARDPSLVREMGVRAQRRAARYTPERMASSYVDIYSSLPAAVGGVS